MKADFQVLIAGSGLSGLLTGILLARSGIEVLLLAKEAITESSSAYAQGGIAAPLSELDSVTKHVQDTIKVGQGACEEKTVEFYISKINDCLFLLEEWGVPFLALKNGKVDSTKLLQEAAHSERRILKIGSDLSGKALMKVLWEIACREKNLSISQGSVLLELLKNKYNQAIGGIVQDINQNVYQVLSYFTVLATGGFASLYEKSTNPKENIGEGLALAIRAGVDYRGLEFVQFHPTALRSKEDKYSLISESVRGEGAILVNQKAERFMQNYAPEKLELASRSQVSYAIWCEEQKGNQVFLDLNKIGAREIKKKFPGICQLSLEAGFDLCKEKVPVSSAAHYTIGGLSVNLESKTSLDNLYAVGEVASSGLHGADRLASNSLLECIVGAFYSSKDIEKQLLFSDKEFSRKPKLEYDFEYDLGLDTIESSGLSEQETKLVFKNLRKEIWQNLSIVRKSSAIREFILSLEKSRSELDLRQVIYNNLYSNELKNAFLVSEKLARSCLLRKESLGCHRIDL